VDYYEFAVGAGNTSITANVTLANDARDPVGSYLVSPDGDALGFGQNSLNYSPGTSLTAYALSPEAGDWTLIVEFAGPVEGNEISQPFTGDIQLDNVTAAATGLPDAVATELTPGTPVTVPVAITNNGAAPEDVFIDARLSGTASISLASLDPPSSEIGYRLPLTYEEPEWVVPTQTSSVQAAASATVPMEFDYGPYQGDPDLFGAPTNANEAAGSYTPAGGTVQPGIWFGAPDEIGPYGPGSAPTGFASISLTATTMAFDPAVTSAGGDLWLLAVNPAAAFSPVTVNPGATVTIPVTIAPKGAAGTVVSGTLYVDDYVSAVPPYSLTSGDQMAAFPYEYTIK
jgi:hypothetical protein